MLKSDYVLLQPLKTKLWSWFFRCQVGCLLIPFIFVSADGLTPSSEQKIEGASYANYRDPDGPWSIHVVRIERRPEFELRSLHADGRAIGLDTLSGQLSDIKPKTGTPVAGVNGDFYQRDHTFAGDPRGLQIVDGELISAPAGGISLWIDTNDLPHMGRVVSKFHVVSTNGINQPFGLNTQPNSKFVGLYTPSLGSSTHGTQGREIVLALAKDGRQRLGIGETYSAEVREIHDDGTTPLSPGIVVLSIPVRITQNFAALEPGVPVLISTKTIPDLRGAKMAISGGPILVHAGQAQEIIPPENDAFEFRSQKERHPRSAIGWNNHEYFLVEVDGRQRGSVGMTLDELGSFLVGLGCQEAMNLDGGGSATLWFDGKVRNRPCDGRERPIANSVAVVRKPK